MLTIDWKERLNKDTDEYFSSKLPVKDYDFEIIFIAYPERTNGKIPHDVIAHVAGALVQRMGKNHAKYVDFLKHLWTNKGEYGRQAFTQMLAKLLRKNNKLYIPLLQDALASSDHSEMLAIMDKVVLPNLRKKPDDYLPLLYSWSKSDCVELRKQAMNVAIKYIKKDPEKMDEIFSHYQHLWFYPLDDAMADHVQLIKAVAKLDWDYYITMLQRFSNNRDPQIVELICASVQDWHPLLEEMVGNWTKSGNARVKKAALAAQKLLSRKKKKA